MKFKEHVAGLSWRFLQLTQDQSSIVDGTKINKLRENYWHAAWNEPTQSYYAVRGSSVHEGFGDKQYTVRMHRSLMGLNKSDKRRVDHENCDTLDNRMCNLRFATHAENMRNRKLQRNNTTGYKGVTKRKGYNRWIAQISINGTPTKLGSAKTPHGAYKLYCAAANRLYGSFARLA